MQKRILISVLILIAVILVLVGATTKPFHIMVTMAQQFTDGNPKENPGTESQETKVSPNKQEQNSNNQINNNNQEPTESETWKLRRKLGKIFRIRN